MPEMNVTLKSNWSNYCPNITKLQDDNYDYADCKGCKDLSFENGCMICKRSYIKTTNEV